MEIILFSNASEQFALVENACSLSSAGVPEQPAPLAGLPAPASNLLQMEFPTLTAIPKHPELCYVPLHVLCYRR